MKPRERILEAADELFGANGFDATTTREIAEVSEVNKALIHYHFKSKEGLLGSLLDRYYEELGRTVQGSLAGEGSLRERMLRLVDTYVDFLGANRNFGRIVQREASGGKHMDQIRAHMRPLFALGTQLVESIYPSTREGDLAAAQVLTSFYGMVVGYFTYADLLEDLFGTDPMSPVQFEARKVHLRQMVNITLDAIEARESGGAQ
ncbi:MAG: TetR family transcriptional regulator [bacterium]